MVLNNSETVDAHFSPGSAFKGAQCNHRLLRLVPRRHIVWFIRNNAHESRKYRIKHRNTSYYQRVQIRLPSWLTKLQFWTPGLEPCVTIGTTALKMTNLL